MVSIVARSVAATAQTERELPGVKRLGSDQLRTFDQFYQREFAPMVSLACTICGDYQQGEDLAQEAMARAHSNWERIVEFDKPGAWVRRVTTNLALSRVRRLKREVKALRRIGTRPDSPTAPSAERVAELQFDTEVWDAVRQLPPRQRAVVGLFYQEDLSTGDIAELLGCSVSTATSHLNQARQQLARHLETTSVEAKEVAR